MLPQANSRLFDILFVSSFVCSVLRKGEGHFRLRGGHPDSRETETQVGQKYRLRETDLRLNRERSLCPARSTCPATHTGKLESIKKRVQFVSAGTL